MHPDDDSAKPGFCEDCPDHEACATGYTCATVKASLASFKRAMADVGAVAKKASAALAAVPVPTVTTRPRLVGGMEGDIVQSVRTTVPMDSGRAVVERIVDEAEEIIRAHAHTYGYHLIGAVDARSRVRNDPPAPCVEIIVEARLRPRFDGIWGEVRRALAEDKADLAVMEGKKPKSSFATGGVVTASHISAGSISAAKIWMSPGESVVNVADVGGASWTWNAPPIPGASDGDMHINGRTGVTSVLRGGSWVEVKDEG